MVEYGQLVVGPPGSGKTTYCEGMRQLLESLKRPHLVINLDVANDWVTKKEFRSQGGQIVDFADPDVDVRDLITLEQVMKEQNLGPNGGLVYCNKYLSENVGWLKDQIKKAKEKKGYTHAYMLFDMPGQVELYTVDHSIHDIIHALADKDYGIRLVAVHLIDSTLCIDLNHYISALLISLSAQLSLELPFLNVFTKIDLLDEENDLKNKHNVSLEFLSRAEDLGYILPLAHQVSPVQLFAEFHQNVIELVEDYSLTAYLPLNIQNKESALSVLGMADNANGFAMSAYVPSRL
ncbi:ATP-binding protein, partial [Gregarina niphandrodes]